MSSGIGILVLTEDIHTGLVYTKRFDDMTSCSRDVIVKVKLISADP